MCNAVRQQLLDDPSKGLDPSFNGAVLHIIEAYSNLIDEDGEKRDETGTQPWDLNNGMEWMEETLKPRSRVKHDSFDDGYGQRREPASTIAVATEPTPGMIRPSYRAADSTRYHIRDQQSREKMERVDSRVRMTAYPEPIPGTGNLKMMSHDKTS